MSLMLFYCMERLIFQGLQRIIYLRSLSVLFSAMSASGRTLPRTEDHQNRRCKEKLESKNLGKQHIIMFEK